MLSLLGMASDDVAGVLAELRALALVRAGLSEADVAAALDERAQARQAKDFARWVVAAAPAVGRQAARRSAGQKMRSSCAAWRCLTLPGAAPTAAAAPRRAPARLPVLPRRSDEIRIQLAAKGVLVMDTPTGSTWRPGLLQQ